MKSGGVAPSASAMLICFPHKRRTGVKHFRPRVVEPTSGHDCLSSTCYYENVTA